MPFSQIAQSKTIFFPHERHTVVYNSYIGTFTFCLTLSNASYNNFSLTILAVQRIISVARGFMSQAITLLLFFRASKAVMPLPANGSKTIPSVGQYVLMYSETTFHVLRDQNLCHKYIDV